MEEVVEGIGKGILRFIKWVIIDLFVELFLYGYGYLTLKISTLGKYPKPNKNNENLCSTVGFIALVITIILIAVFNNAK